MWGSSGLNLKGEPERAGGRFFEPVHQTVESILDTLSESSIQNKHDAHTPPAVATIDVRTQERLAGDAEVITSAGVSAGIDLAPAPRGPSGRRRGRGTVRRGTPEPRGNHQGLGVARRWPPISCLARSAFFNLEEVSRSLFSPSRFHTLLVQMVRRCTSTSQTVDVSDPQG